MLYFAEYVETGLDREIKVRRVGEEEVKRDNAPAFPATMDKKHGSLVVPQKQQCPAQFFFFFKLL